MLNKKNKIQQKVCVMCKMRRGAKIFLILYEFRIKPPTDYRGSTVVRIKESIYLVEIYLAIKKIIVISIFFLVIIDILDLEILTFRLIKILANSLKDKVAQNESLR